MNSHRSDIGDEDTKDGGALLYAHPKAPMVVSSTNYSVSASDTVYPPCSTWQTRKPVHLTLQPVGYHWHTPTVPYQPAAHPNVLRAESICGSPQTDKCPTASDVNVKNANQADELPPLSPLSAVSLPSPYTWGPQKPRESDTSVSEVDTTAPPSPLPVTDLSLGQMEQLVLSSSDDLLAKTRESNRIHADLIQARTGWNFYIEGTMAKLRALEPIIRNLDGKCNTVTHPAREGRTVRWRADRELRARRLEHGELLELVNWARKERDALDNGSLTRAEDAAQTALENVEYLNMAREVIKLTDDFE